MLFDGQDIEIPGEFDPMGKSAGYVDYISQELS